VLGDLEIRYNPKLTTVTGFEALTRVESFSINRNRTLTDIPSFSSLQRVIWDLALSGNTAMTHYSGFESLTDIGYALWLDDNEALTNISGFEALTHLRAIRVMYNPKVANFSGFGSLTTGEVYIDHIEAAGFCDTYITPLESTWGSDVDVQCYDNVGS
jgi:hypothetical protein